VSSRHVVGFPDRRKIMARIVVTEFVSLDGVMEDPGGAEGFKHGGWSFRFDRSAEGDRFKLDELQASDALLLGRVTYQGFAQAWPSITDEGGFAEKMNSMRKYVVSATLTDTDATWDNTTVLRGDVATEVARLKAETSGDILVEGSCLLTHTLTQHRLVDEYRLMVFPIILGQGKRLFADTDDATRLTLVASATAGDGILMLVYRPTPMAEPGAEQAVGRAAAQA
jgi:dihydrofolate reductase